jgi:protein-tyrosine phosphatase
VLGQLNWGFWKVFTKIVLCYSRKLVGWMMIGRKERAIREVGSRVLQPKGLQGLNYDFLNYCGEQIIQVIRIMIASATYPILIHCTQGKDRTGLVIAIVLLLCDVPRPLIIQDYVKTQKGLEAQRDVMVQEMAKTGLDPTFSDAPEEVIVNTLKYLDDKYGGAEGYVKKYELQDDEIRTLRAIFVAEGLSRQSNVVNANAVVALKQTGYDDLVV